MGQPRQSKPPRSQVITQHNTQIHDEDSYDWWYGHDQQCHYPTVSRKRTRAVAAEPRHAQARGARECETGDCRHRRHGLCTRQFGWRDLRRCLRVHRLRAEALAAARPCAASPSQAVFPPRLYHVASDFLAAVCPKDYDLEGNLIGDKAATVIFDCTKLKRAVPGFQATTRFDKGVRRCIDYILAHPELQVDDPEFDQWCDKVIEAQEQAKKCLSKWGLTE